MKESQACEEGGRDHRCSIITLSRNTFGGKIIYIQHSIFSSSLLNVTMHLSQEFAFISKDNTHTKCRRQYIKSIYSSFSTEKQEDNCSLSHLLCSSKTM